MSEGKKLTPDDFKPSDPRISHQMARKEREADIKGAIVNALDGSPSQIMEPREGPPESWEETQDMFYIGALARLCSYLEQGFKDGVTHVITKNPDGSLNAGSVAKLQQEARKVIGAHEGTVAPCLVDVAKRRRGLREAGKPIPEVTTRELLELIEILNDKTTMMPVRFECTCTEDSPHRFSYAIKLVSEIPKTWKEYFKLP